MKDYIETQYKNLDFTIPDDYVSRREVYAMLDYIGGTDADEAYFQGWDAAIDEACSLLNDVDSAMGWTPVEEELPEETGVLLVTIDDKRVGFRRVCVAQYWAVDKQFVVMRSDGGGVVTLYDVVAWKPFPEAYGVESDGNELKGRTVPTDPENVEASTLMDGYVWWTCGKCKKLQHTDKQVQYCSYCGQSVKLENPEE